MSKPAPPLSKTQRWDKAKWHEHEAGDHASRHIVAVLKFLKERKQLTPEGARELNDGDALLAEHVKPAARSFLDAHYDAYLAAEPGYVKPPPIQLLVKAWKTYARDYDLAKRPKGTPLDALALRVSPEEPTLRGILEVARWKPELASELSSLVLTGADAKLLTGFWAASQLGTGMAPKTVVATIPAANLVGVLGYVADRGALATLALAVKKLPAGAKYDEAIANAINGRTRKDWLKLAAPDRKRLRAVCHRLLKKDPLTALFALRTAADASTLPLIENEFPDEGWDEHYRETKTGVELARVAREHDDLRRAIRKVVGNEARRATSSGRATSRAGWSRARRPSVTSASARTPRA